MFQQEFPIKMNEWHEKMGLDEYDTFISLQSHMK